MSTWDSNSKTRSQVRERQKFDPSNSKHIEEVIYFKKHSKWKTVCPFENEWPWSDIPRMIDDRITRHFLANTQ
jgi:hypothetical protein